MHHLLVVTVELQQVVTPYKDKGKKIQQIRFWNTEYRLLQKQELPQGQHTASP